MASLTTHLSRRTLLVLALAVAVIVAAIVVIVVMARASSSPNASTVSSAVQEDNGDVVRWWSTPDEEVGSIIDGSEGDSSVDLEPNLGAYCQALDDTVSAGNGLFPEGVDPASDEYAESVTAFVREMQAMAPDEMQDAWQDLGGVMLAIVAARGDASKLDLPAEATEASIASASDTISAHAQSDCGLSIE